MTKLLETLERLPLQETAFAALLVMVAVLLILSLAFAIDVLVLRILNERTSRRWARLEALWEGPLLAALADPETLTDLWGLVEPRFTHHFVDFILRWSRRVRGEGEETLRKAALPYLEPFTNELDAPRVEVRTRAVQTLGTLGLPRYEREILAALDDPSPLVAMIAVRCLSRMRSGAYAAPILQHLARFRDWNRGFLSSMLASIGPEAAEPLRETASDARQPPWVRAAALEALRHLSDLEAGDVASDVVASEDDRELLASALRLLSEVGRPEHLEVIRARAASTDFVIRAHALSALGALGGGEEVPILTSAIEDPSPWVAIHAAQGLHAVGATRPLQEIARSEHPRAALARQVLLEEGSEEASS